METECVADRSAEGTKTRRKEGKVRKSKTGRAAQPRSPEEGRMYFMVIAFVKIKQQLLQIDVKAKFSKNTWTAPTSMRNFSVSSVRLIGNISEVMSALIDRSLRERPHHSGCCLHDPTKVIIV